MVRSDDLIPFLVPPDRGGVRRAQGVLRGWNPDTFENVVEFNGLTVPNLQVAAGVEALTFQTGDVVLLEGLAPEDALGSWMITGRVITPGPGAALRTIEFMRTTLARQLSAEVFAQQIHFAEDGGVAFQSSSSFNDPSSGNPGPLVADVPISDTGRAVAIFSAESNSDTGNDPADNTPSKAGRASVEISGATTRSASAVYSTRLDIRRLVLSTDVRLNLDTTPTRVAVFDDLNEGLHEFRMVYRSDGVTDFIVQNRTLMIIAT